MQDIKVTHEITEEEVHSGEKRNYKRRRFSRYIFRRRYQ